MVTVHPLSGKKLKQTVSFKYKTCLDIVCRVGIQLPTVEVRFEHLTVDAECYVGSRALPTLWNTVINLFESLVGMTRLSLSKKENLTIRKDASGILKPSR